MILFMSVISTRKQFTCKNNDLDEQTLEVSVTHSFSTFMIWLSCSINSSSKDVNKDYITYYHYPPTMNNAFNIGHTQPLW